MSGRAASKRRVLLVSFLLALVSSALAGAGVAGADRTEGDSVTFEVTTGTPERRELEETAEILERRFEALGVGDVTTRIRRRSLVVEGSDVAVFAPLVAGRGQLELRPVLALVPPDDDGAVVDGTVLPSRPTGDSSAPNYVVGPPALRGTAIEDAEARGIPGQGWVVTFGLTRRGIARFNDLAERLFVEPPPRDSVAIVVDGLVLSAPVFQSAHFTRSSGVYISGDFTRSEARSLAAVLRYRPLPVALRVKSTGPGTAGS